jgi:RNA 3'-terminal phosphate cyclase (ATP)
MTAAVIDIDGSMGEGGGQVFRTSLALSVATGQPFRIRGVRAGREKPGLLRQHLTALHAATAVGDAEVSGGTLGSQEVRFSPRGIRTGEHAFSVGTAGSACLVLQTVLPPLLLAGSASRLTLEGGTHNPAAPPFEYLDRVWFPLLRRMGAGVSGHLERAGFYPAGGGRFTAEIEAGPRLGRLDLLHRGEPVARRVRAIVSHVPESVARREVHRVCKRMGWDEAAAEVTVLSGGVGPGNVLQVEVEGEHVTELFTGFGTLGVAAERVAHGVVDEVRDYLAADVPVGPHLADQLLLPLALGAGGSFRTLPLSRHATTQIEILQRFLPVRIDVEAAPDRTVTVRVAGQ